MCVSNYYDCIIKCRMDVCNIRFDIFFYMVFMSICFMSYLLIIFFIIIFFCLLLFWMGFYEYGYYFLYFVCELEVYDGDVCYGKNWFWLDV